MKKIFCGITAALIILSGCTQQQPNTLKYAEPAAIGGLLIFTALDEGFFEEEGLNVTSEQFSAGRLAIDAVLTSNAQMASTSETPIMHAILQGNDVVIIASVSSKYLAL